jgi:HPt (histidine-containing phosphotransfer) domain-containing protein
MGAVDPMTPIDAEVLLGVSGGCLELAAELVDTFLEEIPGERARLAEAVTRRDAAGLKSAAHRLAGSLGLIGANGACDYARVLERMGREGRLAGLDAAWHDLERALADVLPALVRWRHGLLAGVRHPA